MALQKLLSDSANARPNSSVPYVTLREYLESVSVFSDEVLVEPSLRDLTEAIRQVNQTTKTIQTELQSMNQNANVPAPLPAARQCPRQCQRPVI